jgi:CheY-like chemotaxis protein
MSEAHIPSATPWRAPVIQPARTRVLIVDDDRPTRLVCANYCDLFDHVSHDVHCLGDALSALRRECFDLVVLSLHMTSVGGIAAMRAIRSLPAPAAVAPLIGLAAVGRADEAQRWRAAGFAAVVGKPVTAARFHAALRTARMEGASGQRSWAPAGG